MNQSPIVLKLQKNLELGANLISMVCRIKAPNYLLKTYYGNQALNSYYHDSNHQHNNGDLEISVVLIYKFQKEVEK